MCDPRERVHFRPQFPLVKTVMTAAASGSSYKESHRTQNKQGTRAWLRATITEARNECSMLVTIRQEPAGMCTYCVPPLC